MKPNKMLKILYLILLIGTISISITFFIKNKLPAQEKGNNFSQTENTLIKVKTDKIKYKKGESVKIYILNESDNAVTFHWKFYVERFEDNNWIKYSAEPPLMKVEPKYEQIYVPAHGERLKKWNQIYYGIEKDNFNLLYPPQDGKCRFIFETKSLKDKKYFYSNEFEIVSN